MNTKNTNNNQTNISDAKKCVDVAAKELWQSIVNFQQLFEQNLLDDDESSYSFEFYLDFLHKSSEFARYIDKNFYND